MTRKQIDALRNKREEVLENGKLVGWYCWSYNSAGKLVRVFVPV